MKKYVLFALVGVLGFLVLIFIEYQKTADGNLHIIFCDVGQGDGILIKSPSGKVVMVDAGPDESVLSCLSENLPFWHRQIDMFVLTHPHSDHFTGVFDVFPVYTVKSFISETLANRSLSYEALLAAVKTEGLEIEPVRRGTRIDIGDGVILQVLAPTDAYLTKTSPGGYINETEETASLVILLTYGTFLAILSGDSEVSGMLEANPPTIDVLHVPHHGSRFGLNSQIVQQMDPEVAVISVGENNYGHPTKEVLDLLHMQKATVFRTDQVGDIAIISDGRTYKVFD